MESRRARDIRPFIVTDVLERAEELERQGRRIVVVSCGNDGEPDFDVPPVVREAAERALRDRRTHYTHSPFAATPGVDLGRHRRRRYGRFARTRSIADIREGVRRLQEWIPTVGPPR